MPHRNQKVWDEGWKAWREGALEDDNPYPPSTEITDADENGAWQEGWMAAEEDQQEQDKEADRGDWEFHQRYDD